MERGVELVGNNVIGKIYKSKKIISLTNGYKLVTKYKSNFGGIKDLVLSFRLEKGEVIIKTNNDLLVNVNELNKNIKIENNQDEILINNKDFKKVNKIIKPDLYNTQKTVGIEVLSKDLKNGIYIPLIVESENNVKVIDIYLITSIYDNKEYIEIKIENIKDEKIVIKIEKENNI